MSLVASELREATCKQHPEAMKMGLRSEIGEPRIKNFIEQLLMNFHILVQLNSSKINVNQRI